MLGPDIEDVPAYMPEQPSGCPGVVVSAVSTVAFNQGVDSVRADGTVVSVGLPSVYMELSIVLAALDCIHGLGSIVGTRKELEVAFAFGGPGLVVPVDETVPVDSGPQVVDDMTQGRMPGRKALNFSLQSPNKVSFHLAF